MSASLLGQISSAFPHGRPPAGRVGGARGPQPGPTSAPGSEFPCWEKRGLEEEGCYTFSRRSSLLIATKSVSIGEGREESVLALGCRWQSHSHWEQGHRKQRKPGSNPAPRYCRKQAFSSNCPICAGLAFLICVIMYNFCPIYLTGFMLLKGGNICEIT